MCDIYPLESSVIDGYNYLLEPISLEGKLKQHTGELTESDAKYLIMLEIDNFTVDLEKS